jgi:uncharacterized membrane protein
LSDTALSLEETSGFKSRVEALRALARVDRSEAAVALRVVYAGAAAYAALFVFAAVVHYSVFESARPDLGDMVQAMWSTLHGHFLESTALNGHQQSRLGAHVDPFLVLAAPLLWIWSSPILLLALQALAVASGALPVFWLARKHLSSSRAAAYFAFAYLLYPATQFNAFTSSVGVHPVSFALPLLLLAVWFLDEERPVAFSVVAVLACTTKEEIPAAVGCLGIWYAVRKGHRLFGASVFAVGLGLTVFNFLWVIPHFSRHGVDPFTHRYQPVGGTPGGMAHKLLSDPLAFVHAVATGHKAGYLALLLVPFLGLWLFEPLLLVAAVPDLVINLLSSKPEQTTIVFQYTAGIVPFVVAASIFGASRFKKQDVRLSLWVLAGAASIAIYSPIYLLNGDVRALGSSLVAAKEHAVSLIPKFAPVSASKQLGGHLSERRYVYTFPYVLRSKWIVLDINDPTYGDAKGYRRLVRKYEADKAWLIVFRSHGVIVLQRHAKPRE